MKWSHVCPLFGAALVACATAETEDPHPFTPGLGSGAEAGGGAAGPAASGGDDMGGSDAGGKAAVGGSTTGGTFVGGSGAPTGGTSFGMAGQSAGGAPQGGGGAGGNGGIGGAAGTGGKPNGGAGGTAGSGGAGNQQCAGTTVPAKTKWKATALESAVDDPPAKVFDGDNTTRFSTGDPQDGDEWLEIDFGEIVTLNEVTMHTNNNDYFRHYQLRLSNKTQDFAAAILKEDEGKAGTLVVPLAEAHAGRYLNIRQTGVVSPTWWSLHEVSVACK